MTRFPARLPARFGARGATDAPVAKLSCAANALRILTVMSALFVGTSTAYAQAAYPSAEAAAQAFVNALATNDHEAMKHVLGSNYPRYIPTTSIGEDDIYDFLAQWAKGHEIVNDPTPHNGRPGAHLQVGTDGWTLPIPLEKTAQGWRFDAPAANDEILTRRIGRNERSAILTSLAYVDAQNDYHNLTQHYAQKFVSTPGQRDGLYWVTAPGEPESPFGPLAATMTRQIAPGEAYHGYHYRILTAQGAQANGGAQNYVENGVLSKGFGLVAWPAEYGKTGVMTFMVNQNGQVYQKNLGTQTARVAPTLKSFDPDSSWQPAQP